MVLSKYQEKILTYFKENPTKNIFINALAGTGKSFIVCKMLETVDKNSLYLAFNKSIAEEFKGKITNPKVKVYTIHGLCNAVLNQNIKEKMNREGKLDNFKIYNIVDQLLDGNYKYRRDFEYKTFVRENFVQFYNLVRLNYLNIEDKTSFETNAVRIIRDHNLFVHPDYSYSTLEAIQTIKDIDRASVRIFESEARYDFTDMLYITLKKLSSKQWSIPGWYLFSNICLDECQDLSTIQIFLIKHFRRNGDDSRIVAVGDKNQAIYFFSGANSNSYNLIKKIFTPMQEFDLPINYRCPKTHLLEVNEKFDIPIQPRPDAPMGSLLTVSKKQALATIQPGDYLIGRKNKWLFPMLMELIEMGKPVYIKDKNFVEQIKKFVEKSKKRRVDDLLTSIKEARKALEEKTKEEAKEINTEIYDVMEILIKNFKDNYETNSITMFNSFITKILNTEFSPDCIFVSSIHCCKGLESNNVFVLNEAEPTLDGFLTPEQKQQEKNLSYIALTRSRENLYLVKAEGEEYN